MSQPLSVPDVYPSDDALGVLQTTGVREEVCQDILPLVFGLGCALSMLLLGGLWWSLGQTSEAHSAPVSVMPSSSARKIPAVLPPQAANSAGARAPEALAQPNVGLSSPVKSVSTAPKATPRSRSAWYKAHSALPCRQKVRKAPRFTPKPPEEPKWLRDWRHMG
ncbi:MAG: hypothetical protein LBB51_07000 [Zoogloeaceae bacterium]|jgi:hypothetical protein|nr:hypothetical protein [Zoogloeaceae bacterium]